jgi:hypothetical protein
MVSLSFSLEKQQSKWSNDDGSVHAMHFSVDGFILDTSVPGCDKDGWVYAFNFSWLEGGRHYKKSSKRRAPKKLRQWVRRRRWVKALKTTSASA